jgi:hypothetical protein
MPGAPTAITAPHAPARTALLLIIPLTLAAMVYHPITRVYFFADDLSTLAMAASDSPVAFVLRPFGGHLDVTRNLVFLTSYRLFGMRAELFYWTVLLTHLLNVWLLFRVLRSLTASNALACIARRSVRAHGAGRSARRPHPALHRARPEHPRVPPHPAALEAGAPARAPADVPRTP